jgi:hypothetical protein
LEYRDGSSDGETGRVRKKSRKNEQHGGKEGEASFKNGGPPITEDITTMSLDAARATPDGKDRASASTITPKFLKKNRLFMVLSSLWLGAWPYEARQNENKQNRKLRNNYFAVGPCQFAVTLIAVFLSCELKRNELILNVPCDFFSRPFTWIADSATSRRVVSDPVARLKPHAGFLG